ncbi:MAG: hypothetical protein JRK53_17745 [Deltaproteobacteria bacterium]|nr:hypothetical protein [Deltaproteobacteria bacterium]MBW1817515.1 hypothetical protein [Deltaproteobacteria bacterium]
MINVKFNRGFLTTVLFACLALSFVLTAGTWAAAEDPEVDELGEGRKWIPEISFPPSDPDQKAGYIFLWDRDIYYRSKHTDIYLSWKRGAELTIDKSDFYLRVGMRAYVDFVRYFEDKNDLGGNDAGLRTFMVEMNGRLKSNWLYRISWGGFASGGRFDGGGAYIDDLYVAYTGFEKVALVGGQQREPFSLEEMTSSLATTFMERALPNALVTGTNLGLSFSMYRKWWGLSAGLFAEDLANSNDLSSQGYGITGHVHFNPQSRKGRVWHVGGSLSLRDISDTEFYFQRRPESGLTDVRYVDTGGISHSKSAARVSGEMAVVEGPFSFQGEYIGAYLDRKSGFGNLMFHGLYAFASWFPTGESRRYYPKEGIFGYPEIKGKYGALELAARYSYLDLTDGPITGGREHNITFGVNWYLTPKIRLMANYIMVFCDRNADADGTLEGGDEPHIFQMRFQFRI